MRGQFHGAPVEFAGLADKNRVSSLIVDDKGIGLTEGKGPFARFFLIVFINGPLDFGDGTGHAVDVHADEKLR